MNTFATNNMPLYIQPHLFLCLTNLRTYVFQRSEIGKSKWHWQGKKHQNGRNSKATNIEGGNEKHGKTVHINEKRELILLPEVVPRSQEWLQEDSKFILAGTLYVPRDVMGIVEQGKQVEVNKNGRLATEIMSMEKTVGKDVVTRVLESSLNQLKFLQEVEKLHQVENTNSVQDVGGLLGDMTWHEVRGGSRELWSERYINESDASAHFFVDSKLEPALAEGSIHEEQSAVTSSIKGENQMDDTQVRAEDCFRMGTSNLLSLKFVAKGDNYRNVPSSSQRMESNQYEELEKDVSEKVETSGREETESPKNEEESDSEMAAKVSSSKRPSKVEEDPDINDMGGERIRALGIDEEPSSSSLEPVGQKVSENPHHFASVPKDVSHILEGPQVLAIDVRKAITKSSKGKTESLRLAFSRKRCAHSPLTFSENVLRSTRHDTPADVPQAVRGRWNLVDSKEGDKTDPRLLTLDIEVRSPSGKKKKQDKNNTCRCSQYAKTRILDE